VRPITFIGLFAVGVATVGGVYWAGRKSATPKLTRYSQIMGGYLIDKDVVCPARTEPGPDGKPRVIPGRSLGKVQVDLDLTNGKLHVVRNDPGLTPTCP
jgi:hypothetical protein